MQLIESNNSYFTHEAYVKDCSYFYTKDSEWNQGHWATVVQS